ncbi:MAG: hypothetical protein V7K48_26040 [Nostoc sp.]
MKAIEVQNGFLVEYDVKKLLVNCLNSAARNSRDIIMSDRKY